MKYIHSVVSTTTLFTYVIVYTLTRQKCKNTTKYPCTDFARKLNGNCNIQVSKVCCVSINFGEFFDFLTFHEVFIYLFII